MSRFLVRIHKRIKRDRQLFSSALYNIFITRAHKNLTASPFARQGCKRKATIAVASVCIKPEKNADAFLDGILPFKLPSSSHSPPCRRASRLIFYAPGEMLNAVYVRVKDARQGKTLDTFPSALACAALRPRGRREIALSWFLSNSSSSSSSSRGGPLIVQLMPTRWPRSCQRGR